MKNSRIMELVKFSKGWQTVFAVLLCLFLLCSPVFCTRYPILKRLLEEDDDLNFSTKRLATENTTQKLNNFDQPNQKVFPTDNESVGWLENFDLSLLDTTSNEEPSQSTNYNESQEQLGYPERICQEGSFENETLGQQIMHSGNSSHFPEFSVTHFENQLPYDQQSEIESTELNYFLLDEITPIDLSGNLIDETDSFLELGNVPMGTASENESQGREEDSFNVDEIFDLITKDYARDSSVSSNSTGNFQSNSNTLSNAENLTILNYSQFEFSLGKVGKQKKTIDSNKFKISFTFFKFYYYFGTNELKNAFLFKYLINSLKYFYELRKVQDKSQFIGKIIKKIPVFSQSITTSQQHQTPLYYVFGGNEKKHGATKHGNRVPFYFLFTSISHLMQTNITDSTYTKSFKRILKHVYLNVIGKWHFTEEKWKFLEEKLKELKVIDVKSVKSYGKKCIFYDVQSISFIYTEMKQNENTKEFFEKVWNACKIEYRPIVEPITICSNPLLKIPKKVEKNTKSFHLHSRKLYQIKFTDFLLKRAWESIDDLLSEYSRLKKDFELIDIDFRLRIFSRNDFELLIIVLKEIKDGLKEKLPSDILTLYNFLVELEIFTQFKCSLFFYDLFSKLNGNNDVKYSEILDTFKEIEKYFTEIHQIIPKVNTNSEDITEMISYSNTKSILIPLRQAIEALKKISSYSVKSSDVLQKSLSTLSSFMIPFDYLEFSFAKLPESMSRFQCAEFVAKLDKILSDDNKYEIEKIFTDSSYSEYRKLWIYRPGKTNLFDDADKKQYLEHFKSFLILYNQ